MSKPRGIASVTFEPQGVRTEAKIGMTVLETAQRARVPIRTRCGGVAGCLMCKVEIAEGSEVSGRTDAERRKLGEGSRAGQRLSCQTRILGDAVVIVPEDPLKAAVRAQLAKRKEEEEWP
ncbi:2Fe-2S iron-sulfur cluster-binding protein [Paenibacillus thermoaerophilus]|uniref:2Fe-2S iron-sulfur cluster-binding protein n=1 Tax=Paenibacillus thermoaerophilus TaxID=1215385 RepID=A0ABW2V2S6_9BACL|nr:2Fe-2S iron-sulfur cluster-binding protein [Paenibacillus thermoaerophilus]TMV18718.1 2Fe-2S iron-sulfur cluster binding domain-containing protein [Paenibacillus thermoaerophilus]